MLPQDFTLASWLRDCLQSTSNTGIAGMNSESSEANTFINSRTSAEIWLLQIVFEVLARGTMHWSGWFHIIKDGSMNKHNPRCCQTPGQLQLRSQPQALRPWLGWFSGRLGSPINTDSEMMQALPGASALLPWLLGASASYSPWTLPDVWKILLRDNLLARPTSRAGKHVLTFACLFVARGLFQAPETAREAASIYSGKMILGPCWWNCTFVRTPFASMCQGETCIRPKMRPVNDLQTIHCPK